MDQPFLQKDFHVQWSTLNPENLEADIQIALERGQAKIDAIAQQGHEGLTFDNTLLALEYSTEDLERAWGYVGHLDSVCNSPELREPYNAMLPKVSEFYTRIPLNAELWSVIKAYSETEDAQQLTGTRKRLLDETLYSFKQSGADLPPEKKEQLEKINSELSQITQKYSEHSLDSTNAWDLIIDDLAKLKGLPQSALDSAKQSALQKDAGSEESPKWRFTLQAPSLMPVIKYLEDDSIRKTVWEAASKIASEEPYDNSKLIWKILELRHQKAKLLGNDNFADLVLQKRMAQKGQNALDFVEDLHQRVKAPFAEDLRVLEEYKAEKSGTPHDLLEPWETAYWAEKRRLELFDLDEEALRPYFPLEKVISGMFSLVQKLYGVTLKQRSTCYKDPKTGETTEHKIEGDNSSVEVWHPEVHYFELYDEAQTHLGSFYTDWHPRETKRSGAWMNSLQTGGPQPDGTFKPHLGLMCGNMSPAIGDKPALMTHDEVSTIFHEFGHLLHHLLGRVEIPSLNGTNVAWDFVELPSQFTENWCWERESLDLFARHFETDEPLPEELLQKMIQARTYMEASGTMRQLLLGKMDLELHINYEKFAGQELEPLLQKMLAEYSAKLKTTPPSIIYRFGHIMGSPTGYAAGYYSYKWAEVLDADAFTRFKKEGILNPAVGIEFRDKILSQGNSRPPEELFRDFMGRDPNLDSLLIRAGLKAEA